MLKNYFKEIELNAYKENQMKIREIIENEAKSLSSSLLDVGCGGCSFTEDFLKMGFNVYGMEINEELIRTGREKGVKVKKGDANKKFPFKDKYFDIVVCNQVIEHLYNPDNAFEEIRRVLKNDGIAIISVPNLCSLHNRIFTLIGWQNTTIVPSTKYVFGNPNRGTPSMHDGLCRHLTGFSPKALKEMTEFYGFKIEKLYGRGFHPFNTHVSNLLSSIFPTLSVYLILKLGKIKRKKYYINFKLDKKVFDVYDFQNKKLLNNR